MAENEEPKHRSILENFPDHANLLALIIANWTAIESVMVRWLAYLLKTDYQRSLVIWNELSSLGPKLKMMKRFMRQFMKESDEKDAAIALLGRIQTASELRHRYAHAVYSCTPDAATMYISPGTAANKDDEWIRPTVPLSLETLNSDLALLVSLGDKAQLTQIESIPLTG